MSQTANTLRTARLSYAAASALFETLKDEASTYADIQAGPLAGDSSIAHADAWDDAQSAKAEEIGLYRTGTLVSEAETVLIEALQAYLQGKFPRRFAESKPAFDGALGRGRRHSYNARKKVVELACRVAC